MSASLIVCQGVPGSGKSTWARAKVASGDGKTTRVNRDDLRRMMSPSDRPQDDGYYFSSGREKLTFTVEQEIVRAALVPGQTVIVDDTNLGKGVVETWEKIALEKKYPVKFEVKRFEVPLRVAVERDLRRRWSVGETVIRRMYDKMHPPENAPAWDPTLPSAVICDLDGTLAHMCDRSPYDSSRCGEDTVDEEVLQYLKWAERAGYAILITSGRNGGEHQHVTDQWLSDNYVPVHRLWLRDPEDNRPDDVYKLELYDAHIRGKYNVAVVLDDRQQVVDLWRRLGLKCWQVARGDF